MRNRLLVVDDEDDMLDMVEAIFSSRQDLEVMKARSAREAMSLLAEDDIKVILSDVQMSEMDGMELLGRIRERWPDATVIIMTGYGTIENAVEAMKKGAYDYVTKPFQSEDLFAVVDRAFERVNLLCDKRYLRAELQKCCGPTELVGDSDEMVKVYETIKHIAGTSASVLITGESGTGKELVARAIHLSSKRSERRFVALNCAAIPESVIESELFGYVRGAFTGAIKDKKGLVEEADGGTLFLDEAADISPQTQAKLLRLLQDGEFRAIGDVNDRRVDLRVISASNKELETEVMKGNFREDLYYRLKVVTIMLPPLRERRKDIPLLVNHFVKKYAIKYEKEIKGINHSAMSHLSNRQWKGNVRELENAVARAVAVSRGPFINEKDLFPDEFNGSSESFFAAKNRVLMDFYKTYITSALIRNKGNVSKAAKECGIERPSLHQMMKRCGIDPDKFR